MKELKTEDLNLVSGGIASGDSIDFAYVVRQLVIENSGKNSYFEKTVDGYLYKISTNFVYDKDFNSYSGSYSYEVYKDDVLVASGREADFIL